MTSNDREPRIVSFPPSVKFKSTRIDPDNYVATRLIAELADAWKAYAATASLAPGTVVRLASVIRSVGEFLTNDADRFLTLSGGSAAVTQRLHEWESAMVARFPSPSVRAKDLGMELRNHVARYLEVNGLFEGVLVDWANADVLDGSPHTFLPLDEFSNDERLQLEQTCRAIVRTTEDRLARGDALLGRGRDPRRDGWERVENVLWALRNLPYDNSFQIHLVGKARQLDSADVDRMSGLHRPSRRVSVVAAVGAFLTPSDEYLLATRILLHLQTGWSPEESGSLRRSDLEFADDAVRVRATKLRAARIRWHTLAAPNQQPWGWKAGDLLRRAAHAMRHAHALTPDEPLFWVTGVTSH